MDEEDQNRDEWDGEDEELLEAEGAEFQEEQQMQPPKKKRISTFLKSLPSAYGRWCKNYLQYMVRPGWREDDADKPLAERKSRVIIRYHFGAQQQTNRQMFIADIAGLILNDIPRYTLEEQIFNISDPQRRLRNQQGQQGELIRSFQRPLDRRVLDFQTIYGVEGKNVAARVLITYGEDGNPTVLQGTLNHLNQLYQEGIIDLEATQ